MRKKMAIEFIKPQPFGISIHQCAVAGRSTLHRMMFAVLECGGYDTAFKTLAISQAQRFFPASRHSQSGVVAPLCRRTP